MTAVGQRRSGHLEQHPTDPPPTNVGLSTPESEACRENSLIPADVKIINLTPAQKKVFQSQIESNEKFIKRESHITIVMIIAIAAVLIPVCLKASAAVLFPIVGAAVLFFMFAPVVIKDRYDSETRFYKTITRDNSCKSFEKFLRDSINKLEKHDKRLKFKYEFTGKPLNLALLGKAYDISLISNAKDRNKLFAKLL